MVDKVDNYLRCKCGKIVCEIVEDKVIIKCRHCKRFITIFTDGILEVEYKS
ncbi:MULTISPECIES: hypothetical protein [unclassified Candidatus Frackibacter]|uniref:hypothetical protein n=1 Tax=unclassified Candidatus Frackibacter TaxID=2648818 RepID=UPI00088F7AF3|nr:MULTISPECIES: hypothetical protein [unclassified Candidatus Frackibacter]SDC90038.1 hypothetical protein SAMN04515661_1423 [Candidatus Frackibacter sp. WG11]SEN04129.1 hypothetical protein SAMN04488698_1482 [Candidatus Frackibacter sp. WG12]SFM11811.1 hypothetical protein SAMN04488699_1442 [Candidatus Frackibacter sp. WG13]